MSTPIRDEFLARIRPEHRDIVARVLEEQGFDIDALAARVRPIVARLNRAAAHVTRFERAMERVEASAVEVGQ